jgi:hypothetical protein
MNPPTRLAEKTHRRTCKDCLRASKKGGAANAPPFSVPGERNPARRDESRLSRFRILNIRSLFACVNRSHHVSDGQTMPRNLITDFRKGEEV